MFRGAIIGLIAALCIGCALEEDTSATYTFPDPAKDTKGEDGKWRGTREYSGTVDFKFQALNEPDMSCGYVKFWKQYGLMLGDYQPIILHFEGFDCREPLVPLHVRVYE